MKTILILGAGSLYADTINAVKKAGLKVVCADRNPFAPTRNLAHIFENVDILDVDGLLQIAHRHNVDGIMPLNEFGVIPASEVAKRLGLPGLSPEVAHKCTNKALMRNLWHAAAVRQPDYYVISNVREGMEAALSLGYPFIMKPLSSCASRGVTLVRTPEQVKSLFKETVHFSESGEVVAEGFLDGEEFSVEAVVHHNHVIILAVALKEIIPKFPYRITQALNYGISLDNDSRKDLENQLQKAANALDLSNWVIHSEFILTRRGWEIIELAARGGGGYIFGSIVEYVSGYPYAAALAECVTRNNLPLPDDLQNRGSSFRFLIPPSGRLISISGIKEALSFSNVIRAEMWIKEGDIIPNVTNGTQRSGCIITRAPDFNTAMEIGRRVYDIIRFEVEQFT